MAFSFSSQMNKGSSEYTIQITTDNYEQFLFIQKMARECVDGKHEEKERDGLIDYYFDFKNPFLKESFENDACVNCSNNPKNGGTGICSCTLGQKTIY